MREVDQKFLRALPKVPTGIEGLDDITDGGLPKARPTLVCGRAGCGKTLLGMEFLVRGAEEFGEPGVFMAFEETPEDLIANFASLGHDLEALIAEKKLSIDFVRIESSEIEESGEYDLDGLFIRLGYAIDQIGARRVVLDTVEALFGGLSDSAIVRSELRRLFRWLKDKGVTAIITAEAGDNDRVTRYGLEEYVADCVILLDNRMDGQMATRRLRIAKYRGSMHGTNEYPFLINEGGMSILPITSIGLQHEASTDRVSSGIDALDAMIGGEGYYRGSSILISGTAGTGKTSLAASFVSGAVGRGERSLWFAFEESASQIVRNMRSIGLDLAPSIQNGMLRIISDRPTVCGLEMHLVTTHKLVTEFEPQVVVIDPVSSFWALGNDREVKTMLVRLIDFFKSQKITAVFTSLIAGSDDIESSGGGMSSLMDAWLLLRNLQNGLERNRLLYLLKSRGMAHSNQMREFMLTDNGVALRSVYTGASGTVLTGSLRVAQEMEEKERDTMLSHQISAKERALALKQEALRAHIATLQAEFEVERAESELTVLLDQKRSRTLAEDKARMEQLRQADVSDQARLYGSGGAR